MKTAYATIKHPCFEASPDSVSFDGFWVSGPGFSTGCPHLDSRPGTPKRAGLVVMTGQLIRSCLAGRRGTRPVRTSGGGRRLGPVLPHAPIAQQCVRGDDQLPHHRGHGDLVDLASFPEPSVEPISGLNMQDAIAAMYRTSLGRLRPPVTWRPPFNVPLSRANGATPPGQAAAVPSQE